MLINPFCSFVIQISVNTSVNCNVSKTQYHRLVNSVQNKV